MHPPHSSIHQENEPIGEIAGWLARLGLAQIAGAVIESSRFLPTLLAQGIYLSQPLLNSWARADQIQGLADILEDDKKSKDLLSLLQQRSS